MLQHLIASAIFWLVVTLVLAIAGPVAIVAWVVVAAPWVIAGNRGLLPRTSVGETFLVLVILQVVLDAYWRHVGDALFVWCSWASLTCAIRGNDFPRARVRHYE